MESNTSEDIFTKLVTGNPGKYPERMGQPWTEDETRKLLINIQKKKSTLTISEEHKRTIGAIRAKLRQLAYEYIVNDKRPIEQVMKFTGLSKEDIEDTVKRREAANENAAKKRQFKILKKDVTTLEQAATIQGERDVVKLLQDIYTRMEALEAERKKDLMMITNITMCLKTAIQLLRDT